MSRPWLLTLGVLWLVSACTKTAAGTAPLGAPCTLNGDCQNALVCMDGQCTAGAGTARVCASGALRCNGGDVEGCAVGGASWEFKSACSGRCSNGACVAQECIPNTTRCSSDTRKVEACAADGTGYSVVQTCDLGCANGLCGASGSAICVAGDKRCNGTALEACTPTGTAWAFLQFCSTDCDSATKTCQAPVCAPFSERC